MMRFCLKHNIKFINYDTWNTKIRLVFGGKFYIYIFMRKKNYTIFV